jgi:hypothetical protein
MAAMRDDIRIRIEILKKEIEDACGEKPVFGTAPDCPPEVEEAFLREVLAYEIRERRRNGQRN